MRKLVRIALGVASLAFLAAAGPVRADTQFIRRNITFTNESTPVYNVFVWSDDGNSWNVRVHADQPGSGYHNVWKVKVDFVNSFTEGGAANSVAVPGPSTPQSGGVDGSEYTVGHNWTYTASSPDALGNRYGATWYDWGSFMNEYGGGSEPEHRLMDDGSNWFLSNINLGTSHQDVKFIKLSLENGSQVDCGFAAVVTPEPGTQALFLSVLAPFGLVWLRRRSRKSTARDRSGRE
jgi:hypothetical protein